MPLGSLAGFKREDVGACDDCAVDCEGCRGIAGCGTEDAVECRFEREVVESKVELLAKLSKEGVCKESPPR